MEDLFEPKKLALLLPANGSEIRLVSYDIAYREVDDLYVDADFYDPIPNLRAWLGDAFNERFMLSFHVYHRSRGKQDQITRTLSNLIILDRKVDILSTIPCLQFQPLF